MSNKTAFWAPIDEEQYVGAMRYALKTIARKGCSRLVNPFTCRSGPNPYPKQEWCDGCIAAQGLGLSEDWFQIKP